MSWKCAEISPVVRPLAYNDNTISSTSPRRRCRFFTIAGLNVPSRSLGTAISTSPTASEITVFDRQPLRIFADSRSGSASCFSYPRCSVISSFSAVSSTVFVNSFKQPIRAGQGQALLPRLGHHRRRSHLLGRQLPPHLLDLRP